MWYVIKKKGMFYDLWELRDGNNWQFKHYYSCTQEKKKVSWSLIFIPRVKHSFYCSASPFFCHTVIYALSPLLGCHPGVPDSVTGWHNSWSTHPWWAAKPPAEGWEHHWLCIKVEKIELIRKERTLNTRWGLWFQVVEAISKWLSRKGIY